MRVVMMMYKIIRYTGYDIMNFFHGLSMGQV